MSIFFLNLVTCLLMSCALLTKAQLSFNSNQIPIEGDSCYHYARRIYGVCANQDNCQEVINDFNRGINPQICSYRGYSPIVCCPSQPQAVQPPTAPPSRPIQPQTQFQPAGGSFSRISEQMCDKYSKLTTQTNVVGSFSLDEPIQHTVQKSKCIFTGGGGFIVGGTKTKPGEFPHMALIGWQERDSSVAWKCGGTLISYHFVLTAAHCGSERGIPPNTIRLGEQDYHRSDEGGDPQDYTISRIIKHPNFKSASKYYDIALIQLGSRARMSDYTRPACLWQTYNVDSQSVIATGWGRTNNRGDISTDLLKVSLKVIGNDQCNSVYNQHFSALREGIVETQLCAGDDNEEKDTCQGDSGGPIQILTPKYACTYYVVGITSFGKGCGSGYGVYTRVSQYIDWIEGQVWQSGLE